MKKLLLLGILLAPFIGTAQNQIQLDTVGNACHINQIGFAKDGMTYSLYGDSSLNITIQYSNLSFSNAHYSRFRSPSGSAFANRKALTDWMDTYFFADAAPSGSDTSSGGETPDLETVTTKGSTTPNSILVNGFVGYNPANTGLTLGYTSGIGILANNNPTFSSSILFGNDGGFRIATGNAIDGGTSAVVDFYPIENSGSVGAQFNCRVRGTEGVEASEYIVKSQLDGLFITASSPTLTFGEIPANSFIDLGLDVTGVNYGDIVTLGIPQAAFVDGAMFNAMVSNNSPGVVTIRCANITGSSINVPGGIYKVTIIK